MIQSKEVRRQMGKLANPPYEEWVVTLSPMPQPSTLYALDPTGIGTPYVESMTSYIARLAEAHCLFPGVLMRRVIVPFAEQHSTGEGRATTLHLRDGKTTGALNAAHHSARNAVNALEGLTRQQGLSALTMLSWAEVFPLFGLIRTDRAWCPCCLEEWRTSGRTVYEPLLWAVQAVKICAEHGCRLETLCPKCTRTSHWLSWRSLPGYCAHCHQWLGRDLKRQEENEHETIWLRWCTEQVGMLLALVPTLTNTPGRTRIHEGLTTILDQISQGRKMTFAHLVGLSEKMVGDWFYHQQLPSVENLLRVCFAVNLSLQDFLLRQQLICSLRSERTQDLWGKNSRQSARGFWKTAQVRERLEEIAQSEEVPPLSLKAVARQLGCSDPHSLQIYHPVPCQRI
jgi:hypothetical protein